MANNKKCKREILENKYTAHTGTIKWKIQLKYEYLKSEIQNPAK